MCQCFLAGVGWERKNSFFWDCVCGDAQAQRGGDSTTASVVPASAQFARAAPSDSALSRFFCLSEVRPWAQNHPTWNARENSCGADSQKLRGGKRKGAREERAANKKMKKKINQWKWVRSSWLGITASLRKMLQPPRKAVVEGWCASALLLLLTFLCFWISEILFFWDFWSQPLSLGLN